MEKPREYVEMAKAMIVDKYGHWNHDNHYAETAVLALELQEKDFKCQLSDLENDLKDCYNKRVMLQMQYENEINRTKKQSTFLQ